MRHPIGRTMSTVFFGVGLLVASCDRRSSEGASGSGHTSEVDPLERAPPDPNRRLDLLVRAALDAELQESPIAATSLGVHTADERLDDLRIDAQLRLQSRLHLLVGRLRALDEAGLDPEHRLQRSILLARVEGQLFELNELRPRERSPVFYLDLVNSALLPLCTADGTAADRLRLLSSRLWQIRSLLEEARRNLRSSAPELLVRKAIDVGQAQKVFLADTLPRLGREVSDLKLLDGFRAANSDAVRALDDFLNWLSHDLLPRARGDFALGRDRFLARLRLSDGIQAPPEQLLQLGERELKEARRRYDELLRQLSGGRQGFDVNRLLEDDHPKAEELLSTTQALIGNLLALGRDRLLLPLEAVPVPKVVEMPPVAWGFPRLVEMPPLEPKPREAVLWVDPVDAKWPENRRAEHLRTYHRPALALALVHGVLGHGLQSFYNRRSPSVLAKIALSPLFVEGFAHYVEKALLDSIGDEDLKLRLMLERSMVLRAARLVAVVRLHALGGRLEDAVKVFAEEANFDDYQARREAERAALDPGELSEAVGRLALEKLRADWRREHPEATLAKFHAALLDHGSPPISILRQLLLSTPGAVL